uniref:Uncharacterized protein n=1 Tax=Plectus sambesii TaxID=2011161 RepID=A0A914WLA1_9BILA
MAAAESERIRWIRRRTIGGGHEARLQRIIGGRRRSIGGRAARRRQTAAESEPFAPLRHGRRGGSRRLLSVGGRAAAAPGPLLLTDGRAWPAQIPLLPAAADSTTLLALCTLNKADARKPLPTEILAAAPAAVSHSLAPPSGRRCNKQRAPPPFLLYAVSLPGT